MPVPDEPIGGANEGPKKPGPPSTKEKVVLFLLVAILLGFLFGVPYYFDSKEKEKAARERAQFEEQRKRERKEYADEKKAAEEAYQKRIEEERANQEREYKESCAILEKMADELGATQLEADHVEASFVCCLQTYGEDVPDEILKVAEKLQNDTPFGVSLVLFRPRPHPENLHDFPTRRCVMIGVITEYDRGFDDHIFAIWDSKDLKRFAIGREKINKFLEGLELQKPQYEDPK